jgi:hypothetical protein
LVKNNYDKTILILSTPLILLIIINSYFGLFVAGTYSRETFSWYIQAVGQDIVDLFIVVPILIITSILSYKRNRTALPIWSGIQVFLIYTYSIYCFAVHFNNLFLVYCGALGLSFYSFIYFIVSSLKEPTENSDFKSIPIKTTGIYLLVLAVLFYLIWLKEIVPAIALNTIPKNLIETGILTNPVHVLDLSIFLPGLIITAIFLLRKKRAGILLAPATLVFCILMAVSITILMIVMKQKGQEGDLSPVVVFCVIALISLVLFVLYLKGSKSKL